MHIIQRGINQSLIIGRDMVVTVLEIQPTYVRLGIHDPNSVPAYRVETLYFDQGEADDEQPVDCFDSAEFACAAF
jgi:carbon storage regulator CsrA